MRAVPTWIDKVHDRDKVEQWYEHYSFTVIVQFRVVNHS